MQSSAASPKSPARRARWRAAVMLVAVAVLGVVAFAWWQGRPAPQNTARTAPPIPVTVAETTRRDVPIFLDGLGTVQAANTIAVRSQVDGKLQSVRFEEGQEVHKGDVLAVIDPRPFQAAVDQVVA